MHAGARIVTHSSGGHGGLPSQSWLEQRQIDSVESALVGLLIHGAVDQADEVGLQMMIPLVGLEPLLAEARFDESLILLHEWRPPP